MNRKWLQISKPLFYSVFANSISTGIGFLLVAIVPKIFGVQEYGYWQLYTFYTGYVGALHFGLADGLYLRYGGTQYMDLDKPLFHSQFWFLTALEIIVGSGIAIFAIFFVQDSNKLFILIMTGFCCVLTLPRLFLQFILQGTGRTKEYSSNTILEKVLYGVLVCFLLVNGVQKYEYLIYADAFTKLVSSLFIMWCCRDIVKNRWVTWRINLREAWENTSVGIKLMLANLTGSLIIGIVRFSIEYFWDIETFGKVSLALSVSNLLMVFINAASMVMFPILKRTSQERWGENYSILRSMLVIPILGMLLAYYPISVILVKWLPQYAEGLTYMALLFPVCLYESKMSMLINTYLKALRRERTMLAVNGSCMLMSLTMTFVTVFLMHNLPIAVVSIVIMQSIRSAVAELILGKYLSIQVLPDILREFFMCAAFIIVSWFVGGGSGMLIYGVIYCVYLILKRKEIRKIVSVLF